MIMTGKRNVHACCFLVVLAIFFVTSQASALIRAKDVENQVKEAMGAGTTAEDAVKAAVASAIVEGMSTKDAAAAATKGAVEFALTSAEDVNTAIQGAVTGAANGASAAGQDVNAAIEGACVAVINATVAAGADIQLAAWMAVSASVKHAAQHKRDSSAACCTGVTGVMTGAAESRLSPQEISRVVSGSTRGAMAAAMVSGLDTKAMGTTVQNCVYSTAKTLGFDSAELTMVAAKAGSAADAMPPEAKLPREMEPARKVKEAPDKVLSDPDPIEIEPDPTSRASEV
jgi:hypothetical protein